MDLALNNLQRVIRHEALTTNQHDTNISTTYFSFQLSISQSEERNFKFFLVLN